MKMFARFSCIADDKGDEVAYIGGVGDPFSCTADDKGDEVAYIGGVGDPLPIQTVVHTSSLLRYNGIIIYNNLCVEQR